MRFLPLVLIVFPLLELWLLIEVGEEIGALPTIALVLLSAAAGIAVLRLAGWRTLLRLRSGEPPARELLEGFTLALGGVLLIWPGLIGDVLGLLCLLRPFRRLLSNRLFGRFPRRPGPPPGSAEAGRPITIEGEYRREE